MQPVDIRFGIQAWWAYLYSLLRTEGNIMSMCILVSIQHWCNASVNPCLQSWFSQIFFHLSNRETSHLSLLLYSWGFLCLIWNPTVMGLRYFKTKYMEIFSCRIELESLCPTPLCFGILSPWTVVSSYLKWKLECFPSACIVGAFSELKVWVDLPPHPLESHDPPKLMICLSGWLIFCESVGWKQTSRSMALNQGWLSPPADIWQKSQDFLVAHWE